ncbi:hypothetical protein [Erwinia pyrifoliae]|uniref:Phage protein n=1 Tax=Erwinia pyrifoliae TaxID=79967 RepID=A0ABY5X4F6_ERWPY|nr:hypothetical protein [Erwinia pyrifoliae]AUX72488.1 hypothetical protein CPI84_08350 [Erwinia pyrifoliae]MCA8877260.1 hypothetical protein [Erwinia pyrifoliae]MCT2385105.1 hypothetical protein [Erwinia pyrifoliae]MCU8585671.1 hypothetical protein [Erwinia pyrifoliae]UWS30827.1 hypothetical protein NYP81_05035 [Erwinia pyrifoliae]
MKLSLVIAALRMRCPTFAGNVAGAAEFKSIPETGKMRLPAAYVVPVEDVTAEQKSLTDYWQNVTEGFAVVVVLDNTRDERGQAAGYDAVHDVRAEIWRALLGWEPDKDAGPVAYSGGQLLDMDRGRLYYQFEFISTREISEEDTRQQDDLETLDELKTVAIDMDYIDPGNGPDGNPEHHTEIKLSE